VSRFFVVPVGRGADGKPLAGPPDPARLAEVFHILGLETDGAENAYELESPEVRQEVYEIIQSLGYM